jgi:cell division protein FtsQ
MANEYIYDNYDHEDGFRFKNASTGKIEKNLRRLLIVAAIVLGAECIWLFGVSPCIPLSTLEVKGFPGFDGAAVLEVAGIGAKTSYVSVNVKEAENLIGSHHLVESVRVVKRFPDRLSIYLQPRRAVALSMTTIGGRQTPVYFDKHGVIIKIGTTQDQPAPPHLPVISGIVITDVKPGMRLPAALTPFLHELSVIEENAPVLLDAISEIRINRKPFDGFDIVLYPVHNPVRVLLGNSITEETLRYVLVMLDVFREKSMRPVELDFRSVMSPYSVKEVPSG